MNNCIPWDGKKRKDGRGYIHINKKIVDCARYVWGLEYGDIPLGYCVIRKCKNMECINVVHMFLAPKIIPPNERFFKYISIPENKNLCWIWTGGKDKDGYGIFRVKALNTHRAHRFSYIYHHGNIEDGACVCHTCDNPSCVNPLHLWVGAVADNAKDRDLKNRGNKTKPPIAYGEDNPKSKLTESHVLEIRDLHSQGLSYYKLAKIYPVSAPTIRAICMRKIWVWL